MNIEKIPINFTEVTLRDGEQQHKKYDVMPITDRIAVFDSIVETGIERIEIGHLGNEHDIELAKALVPHINAKIAEGDSRYNDIELQVLFGSQPELMERGVQALDGFDKRKVVVHVYDRVSPGLRNLATEPYSVMDSAHRVSEAAHIAQDLGFTNFSISGEGTVDPFLESKDAIEYYVSIANSLFDRGAEKVNINMPNTFGSSVTGEWQQAGLKYFNDEVKQRSPNVTTSVHTHNDYGSAVDFAVAAVRAGFDRVEGTMTGMGERAGNVSIADVMVRLLEDARVSVELLERGTVVAGIGSMTVEHTVWAQRSIPKKFRDTLSKWYESCVNIGTVYDRMDRFERTSFGNPEAYNAGSGPHDHASREALKDPIGHPMHKNYARSALIHAIMGRPEGSQIIFADPDRISAITVGGHASGGSTNQIQNNKVAVASESERIKAIEIAQTEIEQIFDFAVAA